MAKFLRVKTTSKIDYVLNVDRIIFYSINREGVTNVKMQDDRTIEVAMDFEKFDEAVYNQQSKL